MPTCKECKHWCASWICRVTISHERKQVVIQFLNVQSYNVKSYKKFSHIQCSVIKKKMTDSINNVKEKKNN